MKSLVYYQSVSRVLQGMVDSEATVEAEARYRLSEAMGRILFDEMKGEPVVFGAVQREDNQTLDHTEIRRSISYGTTAEWLEEEIKSGRLGLMVMARAEEELEARVQALATQLAAQMHAAEGGGKTYDFETGEVVPVGDTKEGGEQ